MRKQNHFIEKQSKPNSNITKCRSKDILKDMFYLFSFLLGHFLLSLNSLIVGGLYSVGRYKRFKYKLNKTLEDRNKFMIPFCTAFSIKISFFITCQKIKKLRFDLILNFSD
jgi:hypothetical protein